MAAEMVVIEVTNTEVVRINRANLSFEPGTMFITTTGGALRYTYSRPDQLPTTSHGHQLLEGGTLAFNSHAHIRNFRMIAESTDVTVTMTVEAG